MDKLFAVIDGSAIASSGGTGIPGVRGHVVERNTPAEFEKSGEIGFGGGKALASGEKNPTRGFVVILWNGDAVKIKIPKTILGFGEAVVGGGAYPAEGFVIVARSTEADMVQGG